MSQDTVEGYVDHIIFRNEDNGYTVLNLIVKGSELTCVGTFEYVGEGELLELHGSYVEHATYGQQFKMESYETKLPEDSIAMERYLGSGAIKGVGAALAARIVRKFKDDTLRIIDEEPERLAEVKGISEKKAREIAEQVAEKVGDAKCDDVLAAIWNLGQSGSENLWKIRFPCLYGIKRKSVSAGGRYPGDRFRIADEIAGRIGIHTDSDYRIRSGLFYTLTLAAQDGHVYLPERVLLAKASELLGVEPQYMEKHVMDLAIERKVVVKEIPVEGAFDENGEPVMEKIIYGSQYYYLELDTARRLCELNIQSEEKEETIRKRLANIEKRNELELDELQREAVVEAVKNGLLIITGGPGTGKTTTINAIIQYFELEGMDIFLAAPTGRAAKRMTEATGYQASTIHRLLELSGMMDDSSAAVHFERNEDNPLEADVIIIDEMSMVDINLMHSLLRAVNVGTRLILVGDVDQLPSVGPGNVLRDIIESECFHVVKLTRIFRQAAQSDIIVNAHRINAGERIPIGKSSRDFLFIKRDDPNAIINAMITLVREKLPNYVHADLFEVQVMTPMRKGVLGSIRLNSILQEFLNPPSAEKAEKEYGETTFRVGDKVMQIKNNYQIEWTSYNRSGIPVDKGAGVFNGDLGRIREINTFAELVTVEYDEGKRVEYSFKQLEELELAYAITIHKSQGSEYPAVVIPVWSGPQMLMTRNLIYTAVTRARACVCLVGVPYVFQQMVDNAMEQKRYSGLRDRIEEIMETL